MYMLTILLIGLYVVINFELGIKKSLQILTMDVLEAIFKQRLLQKIL